MLLVVVVVVVVVAAAEQRYHFSPSPSGKYQEVNIRKWVKDGRQFHLWFRHAAWCTNTSPETALIQLVELPRNLVEVPHFIPTQAAPICHSAINIFLSSAAHKWFWLLVRTVEIAGCQLGTEPRQSRVFVLSVGPASQLQRNWPRPSLSICLYNSSLINHISSWESRQAQCHNVTIGSLCIIKRRNESLLFCWVTRVAVNNIQYGNLPWNETIFYVLYWCWPARVTVKNLPSL